ncbi:MAG: oligosaccharide flippase family protein [Chloroflexi bacterium]|nr:oligosaccharide flippase family protein [Chloroflexota bacterium]
MAATVSRSAGRLIDAARQRLSGPAGWLMAGEAINRGGRFLLLLLLARAVGAASYGGWVLAIAAATILANAGDAGIGTIAARDIAADRERTNRYYASLLGLTPLLALLGFGIVLVLAALAPGGASRTLMLLAGLGGVLESAGYLLLSPLRGHGQFLSEGLFRAFQGMALLIVAGGAVLISRGGPPSSRRSSR